jgi:phosphopantetheinyl transferase
MEANEVHLWHADLDAPGADLDALSEEERARAARFLRPLPRRRWEAARCALRAVLGHHLGIAPAAVGLRAGRHGKPALDDPAPRLRFNLSHCEGMALIAVSAGREVGVDLERIGARPRAFYEEWVRREAVGKCFGVGLAEPPPAAPYRLVPLELGDEWAAALAVAGTEEPRLRGPEPRPIVTAAPGRR